MTTAVELPFCNPWRLSLTACSRYSPLVVRSPEASEYGAEFYNFTSSVATRSAAVVVPYILNLTHPTSVVDVGCGEGAWLAAFAARGVCDVLGIDGNWVDRSRLAIPPERFRAADLTREISEPRIFDLVVSLEVAEHLPAESASSFVRSLTSLGDVVLFSAAIPGQGGARHINEQWPSYWVTHFARLGYAVLDCLRFVLWDDDRVAAFYRQNMFLAVRRDQLEHLPHLGRWCALNPDLVDRVPSLVHPALWVKKATPPALRYSGRTLAKALALRSYMRMRDWFR